ncbi:MAG TPA: hypothetical protein VF244_10605 [Acidimicrobiales bacterium]
MRRGTAALALAFLAAACGDGESSSSGPSTSAAPARPTTCTPVGAPAEPIEFAARWSAGDTRSFSLTTTREDSSRPEQSGSATTPMKIRVLGSGSAGFRLSWDSGETILPTAPGPEEQAAVDQLNELGQFSIEYSTDASGAFEQVENLEALRSQVDRVITALGESGLGPEEIEKVREVMLSDSFAETTLMENIVAFHSPYGLVLDPEDSFTAPDELPNALGGRPFPATSSVRVVNPRDAEGCAVLEVVVTPEPGPMAEILAEAVAELTGDDGVGITPEELGRFTVRNTIRYAYDPGSGWMVRVEMEQVIEAAGARRLEREVIEAA